MTNEQYYELIKPYEDASRMLLGRLELLNRNLYASRLEYGPIHNIQSRIKEKKSIEDKLHRLGHRDGVLNARDYLQDIAGIRMICYFVDDIYNMVAVLKKQSDLVIMKEKDYIAFPKPNGYRSYHIVVGMPVYCLDTMEYFRWRCSSERCLWTSGPVWNTEFAIRKVRSIGKFWSRNSENTPEFCRK